MRVVVTVFFIGLIIELLVGLVERYFFKGYQKV